MKYPNIREEELKNKVASDYFDAFDCTKIIGNIDFCVALPAQNAQTQLYDTQSFLWAEAKKGASDIYKSIVQLILTVGKARTFDEHLPPAFLGAFDAEKIAFLPYSNIQEVFYQNDFNWNVTPSNHETKEFKQVHEAVRTHIDEHSLLFVFGRDDKEIRTFAQENFVVGKTELAKIKIDKNNFVPIYNKWRAAVMPSVAINWDATKKKGIIDSDFYLADLLSMENKTLKDKLSVVLSSDHYELDKAVDDMGLFVVKRTFFNDKQRAHTKFWKKYERPPKEEYWDYIINRRDLLVPQDVRERKGSFFTPQIWVELSQRYLADVLGEDWQDDYYIWDCAAGTGNLLAGLTNKYNIWASTLDRQDVDVMKERIDNGANLLEEHVFQFDFLNDSFDKLPDSLQKVLNNPEKRKKLVIYINPPYAESNGRVTTTRSDVHVSNTYIKYAAKLEKAGAELFAQFLARIYFEIPDCIIAQFSKLKMVSAPNSRTFRNHFLARLEKAFVVPADTFDNVTGKFPIGFFVWNTAEKERIESIKAETFNKKGQSIGFKQFHSYDHEKGTINDWLSQHRNKLEGVGTLVGDSPDFQNNNFVCIQNGEGKRHAVYFHINEFNLSIACIYLAVRHCIEETWLNDRDQFLYPNEGWAKDSEFQNDCLAYALFHGQNRIAPNGENHWIPFRAQDVEARAQFQSDFMYRYIAGKLKSEPNALFAGASSVPTAPLQFSEEAQAVFAAGKALWRYYHAQPASNPDASLYEIKAYFQGRDAKGKMNSRSEDEDYSQLLISLRDALKALAQKIAPKVYEYGFLKG